jgi:hypothetical protein
MPPISKGDYTCPHILVGVIIGLRSNSGSREQMLGNFSFLNRTIVDWNQLPAAVFEGSPMNLCKFKRNLRKL